MRNALFGLHCITAAAAGLLLLVVCAGFTPSLVAKARALGQDHANSRAVASFGERPDTTQIVAKHITDLSSDLLERQGSQDNASRTTASTSTSNEATIDNERSKHSLAATPTAASTPQPGPSSPALELVEECRRFQDEVAKWRLTASSKSSVTRASDLCDAANELVVQYAYLVPQFQPDAAPAFRDAIRDALDLARFQVYAAPVQIDFEQLDCDKSTRSLYGSCIAAAKFYEAILQSDVPGTPSLELVLPENFQAGILRHITDRLNPDSLGLVADPDIQRYLIAHLEYASRLTKTNPIEARRVLCHIDPIRRLGARAMINGEMFLVSHFYDKLSNEVPY